MSLSEYQAALPGIFPVPTRDEEATPEGAGPGDSEPALKKELADIVEVHKFNKDGGTDVQVTPTRRYLPKGMKQTSKARKYESHGLILRRALAQRDQRVTILRVELEIHFPRLCSAIKRLVRDCYETTNLQGRPLRFAMPFFELFFYRKEIQNMAEDEGNGPELREEAQLLHDFVRTNGLLSSIIHDHDAYSHRGQVAGDIIWTIYPPNSLAILNVDAVEECWIVRNVTQVSDAAGNFFWKVTGLQVGCDGTKVGLIKQSCIVCAVSMDLRNISELPLVPVGHVHDWPQKKRILKARFSNMKRGLGESLTAYMTQTYKGISWREANFRQDYWPSKPPLKEEKEIDERVIVDYNAFRRAHSRFNALEELKDSSKPPKSHAAARARGMVVVDNEVDDFDESDSSDNDDDKDASHAKRHIGFDVRKILDFKTLEVNISEAEDKNFDGDTESANPSAHGLDSLARTVERVLHVTKDDFELLFPALVPAFGLKSKQWYWVLTDDLHDVSWNTTAFDSLQHDPATKKLIHALVEGHKGGPGTGFHDLIDGKGQGLIFLLHGEPGLGKTLTAESIADFLQRPLYAVSGGEVGINVSTAERRLDDIFELTKRWNAVTLLDEADVILCKRTSKEMKRNAVVGVFLRKLEYFQGVLFLTTNRKEDFDDAFKSRIHVTIHYPALSNEAQSIIWKRLVKANTSVEVDMSWTEDVYMALGKLNLNGRTIKNILRTAVAFAYADGKALGARHVLAIVGTELQESGDNDGDENLSKGKREKQAQVSQALEQLQQLVQADNKGKV